MPGVTRCTHPETGGVAELPTDALAAYVGRGWVPEGESRSIEAAEVERVNAENDAAALVEPPPAIPVEQSHEDLPAAPVAWQSSTEPTGTVGAEKENAS